MLKDEYKVYEDKMKKSVEAVESDFATVRAGRANASVLNRISVDYYGTPTPIQQIASIASPDPRTLPSPRGTPPPSRPLKRRFRSPTWASTPRTRREGPPLPPPPAREGGRKEAGGTEIPTKAAGRGKSNIRRDAMDNFKKQQKASEITEDELKIAEKDLQSSPMTAARSWISCWKTRKKELMSV